MKQRQVGRGSIDSVIIANCKLLGHHIDLDRKSERTTNDVVINMLEFVAGVFFQLKL